MSIPAAGTPAPGGQAAAGGASLHKPRLGRRGLWIVIGAVVLVTLLVVGGIQLLGADGPATAEATATATAAPQVEEVDFVVDEYLGYDLVDEYLDIDPARAFTFPIQYDLEQFYDPLDLGRDQYTAAFEVFVDPALTVRAPYVDISTTAGGDVAVIKPWGIDLVVSSVDENSDVPGAGIRLQNAEEWGFSDEYFIVEKLDPATGSPLPVPRVTRFTVAKDVPEPEVSFSVDGDGVGHFTWPEIDGVSTYYVVAAGDPLAATALDSSGLRIIGESETNEWTTLEDDAEFSAALAAGDVTREQNSLFEEYSASDDWAQDFGVLAEDQEKSPSSYGVIAVRGTETSAFAPIDNTTIASSLPQERAREAARQLGTSFDRIGSFDEIPTRLPITVADGSTVLRSVLIDEERPTIGEYVDGAETVQYVTVPYTIKGTMLGGAFRVASFDESTYVADVERIRQRNQKAESATGRSGGYEYASDLGTLEDVGASTSAPAVPYPVSGTNSFTTYLAANLLAGERYIDVNAYLPNDAGIRLRDALDEAILQNPLILEVLHVSTFDDQGIIEVTYAIADADERVQEQQETAAVIDAAVAEIITPGMSDEEKARAINNFLVETAEYDYAALAAIEAVHSNNGVDPEFRRASLASGALLDHKAVCVGYATAFKAMADAAGLQSVVVTGQTDDSGHAWNKVMVNGAWRIVDVTWNDAGDVSRDEFLFLTDEQASATRTQDMAWVVDALVGNYAAL